MATAIRILDKHAGANGPGTVAPPGVPTVLISGLPAGVVGTVCIYDAAPLADAIDKGSPTVTACDLPLACSGGTTVLGNILGPGDPSVEVD